MAGIKGMSQPGSAKSPVPGAIAKDALDAELSKLSAAEPAASASAQTQGAPQGDALDAELNQAAPQDQGQPGFLSQLGHAALDELPALGSVGGAVVGGVMGAPTGPGAIATGVGGAIIGGSMGQSAKDFIESAFMSKTPKTATQEAHDMGVSGLEQGAMQAAGEGVLRLPGLLAKPVAVLGGQLSNVVEGISNEVKAPLTKMLQEKSTQMTTEEAGNAAKTLLTKNIKERYGPFVDAYAALDQVNQAMPLKDEARLGLTNNLKSWALDNLSGDNYKMVKKFSDDINAVGNGKQLNDVVQQIGDAKAMAFKNGANRQYQVLKQLQEKVMDFADSQTTALASKIQAGKATPQEMQFVNQLAQQRGVVENNVNDYAKSLAKDFLKAKDKVNTDYSSFKSFLEDVGEQTKTSTNKVGPMTFMSNLNEVPSEKLIERMFDPKNAAALRNMQQQTPEVFDVVVKSKWSQIMQKASPTGQLDLPMLQKELNKLPGSTRSVLMSNEEARTLSQVVNDPRLKHLQTLEHAKNSFLVKWVKDLSATAFIGKEVAKKTSPLVGAPVKQAVGTPVYNFGKSMVAPDSGQEQ
jgi:hypothetical protein